MQNQNVLKRHAELLDRMASAIGTDLEEAALRGSLSISEVSDAVLRCTGCSNPDHCESWLDAQTETAAAPPGYCRNAALLASLKV
jgi:hypothetical protein